MQILNEKLKNWNDFSGFLAFLCQKDPKIREVVENLSEQVFQGVSLTIENQGELNELNAISIDQFIKPNTKQSKIPNDKFWKSILPYFNMIKELLNKNEEQFLGRLNDNVTAFLIIFLLGIIKFGGFKNKHTISQDFSKKAGEILQAVKNIIIVHSTIET